MISGLSLMTCCWTVNWYRRGFCAGRRLGRW
jgi:hypothetical protein